VPNNDYSLILAIKSSLNQVSNIVFINYEIPLGFSLGHSYKSIKFIN